MPLLRRPRDSVAALDDVPVLGDAARFDHGVRVRLVADGDLGVDVEHLLQLLTAESKQRTVSHKSVTGEQ